MRKYFKSAVSFFLIPLTRWYLRKERKHTYRGISVSVWPGVFHPGLFSSTHFLLDYLEEQNISGSKLLELGCGTGLISITCAKQGALVTSSDLNQLALQNTKHNADQENVILKLIHSDLFSSIDKQFFDWIIINPPYYAHDPKSDEELAWYCGKDFEYFQKLFSTLNPYLHTGSQVIMVLSQSCELEKIKEVARKHQFNFMLLREKKVLLDGKDFLFRIVKNQE